MSQKVSRRRVLRIGEQAHPELDDNAVRLGTHFLAEFHKSDNCVPEPGERVE
jgi:hypothetical protein